MNQPYSHSYGGTAVDTEVTAECFAETFGTSVTMLDSLPLDEKVGDKCVRGGEILGYVQRNDDGSKRFVVTLIQHRRRNILT